MLGVGVATLLLAWATLYATSRMPAHQAVWLPHGHGHGAGPEAWVMASGMWQLMMIAMMLPVVWPWLRLVSVTHGRPGQGPVAITLLFAGGYFAAWALYSTVAGGIQVWIQARGWLDPVVGADPVSGSLALHGRLAAGVLIVAGVFQFTRLKQACLRHCRSPLGSLLTEWNDGPPGAFRLGFSHGLYCVGCCWALMALGFALGLMNLTWMAVITLVAVLEQLAPGGVHIARVVGALLMAWGVSLWL